MMGSPRRLLRVAVGAFLVFTIAYASLSTWETVFYRKALPEKIGVTGFVNAGSTTPLWVLPAVLLFPPIGLAFRESCGAVLYNLDGASTRDIAAEGTKFFESARQGRGYVGARNAHYYAYSAWRETPGDIRPDKSIFDLGVQCSGASWFVRREISDALRKPGSFYADGPEKGLLVIPSLGIVVMAYFG